MPAFTVPTRATQVPPTAYYDILDANDTMQMVVVSVGTTALDRSARYYTMMREHWMVSTSANLAAIVASNEIAFVVKAVGAGSIGSELNQTESGLSFQFRAHSVLNATVDWVVPPTNSNPPNISGFTIFKAKKGDLWLGFDLDTTNGAIDDLIWFVPPSSVPTNVFSSSPSVNDRVEFTKKTPSDVPSNYRYFHEHICP